jgi:Spy/CpxP family protein refolding chaperone
MRGITSLLLGFTLLTASLAVAQPGPGPGGPAHGHDRWGMDMLKLTDQQKTDLRALRSDLQKSMVKLTRIDLREMVAVEKPDRPAIEKKVKDISALQTTAKLALVDHLFKVNAMLTPEQQKIFKQEMGRRLMEEPGSMMMERHGRSMKTDSDGEGMKER